MGMWFLGLTSAYFSVFNKKTAKINTEDTFLERAGCLEQYAVPRDAPYCFYFL